MKPRFGHGSPPHQGLYDVINENRDCYKEWLVKLLSYRSQLFSINDKSQSNNTLEPFWNNSELTFLDMMMLYTMTVSGHPATMIDISSGVSTKMVYREKTDFGLDTKIIPINPAPSISSTKISDEHVRKPLEKTDLKMFGDLKKGDIVYLDLSHRLFPNSDATIFFLEVLPYLPEGVKVHFHRVYLPYDYPQDMCDKYFSEQYGLAFFLLSNPARYKTIAPVYFIAKDDELKQLLIPFWENLSLSETDRCGSSYWIEIN